MKQAIEKGASLRFFLGLPLNDAAGGERYCTVRIRSTSYEIPIRGIPCPGRSKGDGPRLGAVPALKSNNHRGSFCHACHFSHPSLVPIPHPVVFFFFPGLVWVWFVLSDCAVYFSIHFDRL
ncbi:hypothetical protein LZ32DRAFT_384893 [Colletotrichum eremochloae]|nr:hypothetical protein LZ32DRAFT_384893 [Colletotrichum eremochloae]